MHKTIIKTLFLFMFLNYAQSQNLPEFVKKKLEAQKVEAKEYLYNYRISNDLSYPVQQLHMIFSDREQDIIDSLGLNLHVSMIYDDDMRDRLVELLENKYRQYELDTLVERWMSDMYTSYGVHAIKLCSIDTISLYMYKLDSLNRIDYLNSHWNKYEALLLLKLDTTMAYKNALLKVIEKERKEIEQSILNNSYYYFTYNAELCGYIGDKRFIAPLEKILKTKNNTKLVLEALVRMKVEPYYTNYFNERVRSLDQVINEKPRKLIEDFVWVLGSQEAYLELSKYLLSDMPHQSISIIDRPEGSIGVSVPIHRQAFDFIKRYILNPSLQKIIYTPNFDAKKESDRRKVYKWMQKNYGKYETRRRW